MNKGKLAKFISSVFWNTMKKIKCYCCKKNIKSKEELKDCLIKEHRFNFIKKRR